MPWKSFSLCTWDRTYRVRVQGQGRGQRTNVRIDLASWRSTRIHNLEVEYFEA